MATIAHVTYVLAFPRALPTWKRAMDIFGATVGLLVFSPFFLAAAVYIKLASRGPVIYSSRRVGYGGEEFTMFKFRTMEVGGSAASHKEYVKTLICQSGDGSGEAAPPMEKLDADPRLIPLAALIRKTCIDELPQLLNVLRGEMSLVGPRPCLLYETEEYRRWHRNRFSTVPGMTGLWQVSGKNLLTFREMVALDIRYARELTPLLDMKILILTLPAILEQMGGYLANWRRNNV